MPWRCSQCSSEIGDDATLTCPGCGRPKASWTLVQDKTRTMRVSVGKRFICERGASDAPSAPLAAAYDAAAWAVTEIAPAITTAEARRLADAGQGPAPVDVLRVVQHPGKGAPSVAELTTILDGGKAATTSRRARAEPPHDARFLLVYGEPPDGLTFDGLHVIDVSDDRPEGHAPHLEVVALKRPVQRLTIAPRPRIDWSLFSFDLAHDEVDWSLFSFDLAHDSGEGDHLPASDVDWSLFSFDLSPASPGED